MAVPYKKINFATKRNNYTTAKITSLTDDEEETTDFSEVDEVECDNSSIEMSKPPTLKC